ncbi:TonB-dependent receptor [Mucilaginibacter segetis]|uniref:TonB-dependent receptor n=1 Tax=Mucilaginibacter segetis TaxID=2793071 RepID=A0A934PUG5_9SPHI|nr:TonB-dependent receptor [Mucilaginibacter segetis]MBK0379310.1 TonB-dependent receptor [Mucilaginibacter segetis]
MKITTLLLIVTLLQVSAASRAQKISLSESRAPLTKVLKEIRSQSGFNLVYTEEMLKDAKAVSIRVKDAEMREVLDEVFREQPLSYTIVNNAIVLKEKEMSLLDRIRAAWVAVDVNGRVVDEQGQPLPGATVKVKDGSQATTTDARGEFTLRQVQPDATLVVSFIGFQQLEVKAAANMGNMVMKVAESQLDQVQVIAYGKTSQRLSVGNVSSVSAKDIERQPVNNPLLALEGNVPGLFIQQATGLPGTAVSVKIQGQNSLGNGNDPLYVIDGVPYSSQSLPNLGSILASPNGQVAMVGNSPLGFINPQDIESISVLKDADATSIYGSRAANGAILITTKKGKAGDTRVNFNLQQGVGKVTRTMDLLNAQQYLQMRHEALKNDGISIADYDYDLNGAWDTTRTTDWQKELIGNSAHYTDMQVSLSGGNENTQYLIGSAYHRETTVFPGEFSDQKASLHFNINNTSANKKFKVQLSGSYLFDNNQLPSQDLTYYALQLPPVAPALYNPDGSLNWQVNSSGSSTWINPLQYTMAHYNNKTNNLVSNGLLSYNIINGLTASVSMGYTNMQSKDNQLTSINYYPPQDRQYNTPFGVYGDYNINSWIIEPQLNYSRLLGGGKLDFLLGSTFQKSHSHGEQFVAGGFLNDIFLENISAAAQVTSTSVLDKDYAYNALFGRLNYNFQDKYLINLSARRDGSSRFGPENRFHNFASIGAAWIFSEETLIKESLTFLSLGKLRGSFGTTGNDQIPDYSYLSLYRVIKSDLPYLGSKGVEPTNLSNPYLQWEETRKLQFGLDLGFFKDRVLLNATYYRNRSSNQLLGNSLSLSTGFGNISANLPATVQNSGWELVLNTANIKSAAFKWSSSINLTLPKNKLLKFDNIAQTVYKSNWIVGEPITIIRKYQFEGVDPATGLYAFKDHNGNITTSVSSNNDRIAIVNTAPKFYGGFQNSFQFKGFDLSFLLQFVKQKGPTGDYFGLGLPGTSFGLGNQPTSVLNRWQKPGDQTEIQRYNSDYGQFSPYANAQNSDSGYGDASYIRLKNLSLSYQLPQPIASKIHMQNIRVYTLGQNLLTFTNYPGLDPETKTSSVLPPLKVWTFGVQLTL